MPHWAPISHFTFKGPAVASDQKDASALQTVTSGAQLQVGVTIGPAATGVSSEEQESAAQAAAILRQSASQRFPAGGYQPEVTPSRPFEERPRVSGRVVAETPSGTTLAVLGAFEGEMGVTSTFRVTAPEGPFRIAIHGTAPWGDGKRDFVTRSVLLIGVKVQPK